MSSPNSYKIQVLYNEIPPFVRTRLIDTPFRFSTYEDAITLGEDMFTGVQFRIVGSSDRPHWQSTPLEKSVSLKDKGWYDIYGVSPAGFKQPSEEIKRPQLAETVKVLQRLKPQPVTGGVHPRQLGQSKQARQARQARQAKQTPEVNQAFRTSKVQQVPQVRQIAQATQKAK